MTPWYRVRRWLLGWYYRRYLPSLADAYKTADMLNPGCRLIYYAIYADGCRTMGMYDGYTYFEGDEGPGHAGHLSFVPGDQPVYEWGVSGLTNGQRLTEEQLNELSAS